MADTQYVIGGNLSTPASWTIQPALEIEPKTAYASFNGSGAAGAFYPCLRIISDSGHVSAEAVSTTLVAAGGSADVSWFQDVKQSGQAATSSYLTQALQLGPWAYYTLSDLGTSTFLDSSGHGRTTSYDSLYVAQNGPAILTTSTAPSAILSGPGGVSNNHAITSVVNQAWTATVFTLTAWFKTTYAGTNDQVIAGLGRLDVDPRSIFAIWLVSHIPVVRMFDNTPAFHSLSGSATLNDGNPHMVAASYDGNTLRLYADGALANSTVLGVTLNTNPAIAIEIGMQLGGVSPRTFSGDIAQVGYYDKLLTTAQIANLYSLGA